MEEEGSLTSALVAATSLIVSNDTMEGNSLICKRDIKLGFV